MPDTLRRWALLAVDRTDDGYDQLTEFLQLPGGVLFRDTITAADTAPAVALTYAPGLTLEDAAPGPRLART
jgi:hypothetical protein